MALTDTLIIQLNADDSTSQPVDLLQASTQIELLDELFLQNVGETNPVYCRQGGSAPDPENDEGHVLHGGDGFAVSLEREFWLWVREGEAIVAVTNAVGD